MGGGITTAEWYSAHSAYIEITAWSQSAKTLAKHIVKAAPKAAKVVFENSMVRVIEITVKKGQKLPMHTHNRNLTYGLNESKFRSTDTQGKSSTLKIKKGEATWSEGGESHAIENLGGISRILSVELKG